jgi:NUMOD3 motif
MFNLTTLYWVLLWYNDLMRTFYVYCYLRSRNSSTGRVGTPYYVGKGCGGRAFRKAKKTCPVPTDKLCVTFPGLGMSEIDALQLEVFLIYLYGRKDLGTGILLNRTNGGEGTSGAKITSRKRVQHSEETKRKMSSVHKGQRKSPEMITKLRARRLSEGTRHKISVANKGKPAHNKGKRGKPHSEETRLKMSLARKRWLARTGK